MMYNTGARVQELANLTLADLHVPVPASVTLTGKGKKTRVIPQWEKTVTLVSHYLEYRKRAGVASEHLFLNSRAQPMTRFAIGKRVAIYARSASASCLSLKGRNITPHTFRHTTALHLIEANNDIFLVRDWLGHANVKTTSQYVEVSLERKRKALEKMPPPDGSQPPELPQWTRPDLMDFLIRCS